VILEQAPPAPLLQAENEADASDQSIEGAPASDSELVPELSGMNRSRTP
jgi:hypothetical protein